MVLRFSSKDIISFLEFASFSSLCGVILRTEKLVLCYLSYITFLSKYTIRPKVNGHLTNHNHLLKIWLQFYFPICCNNKLHSSGKAFQEIFGVWPRVFVLILPKEFYQSQDLMVGEEAWDAVSISFHPRSCSVGLRRSGLSEGHLSSSTPALTNAMSYSVHRREILMLLNIKTSSNSTFALWERPTYGHDGQVSTYMVSYQSIMSITML